MPRTAQHAYRTHVAWTGNTGSGTGTYRAYGRDHEVTAEGPPPLPGTADPAFRGTTDRWNPEQLLLASLAQCHMLSYLALCALGGVVVTAYEDTADGTMTEDGAGGGRFTEVVLRPRVEVASAQMRERALALHGTAHEKCFIANSVSFPVLHEPVVTAPQES
ncbi:OsmC family protein [Streptomyces pinistramenti]|uniref:OsmC family protein n=1 Tax=Streptomyces pinistramenti TaxID=2884812 RepID=UPI001D08124B|nr:OsmC family protein [Streptomyces pinistramenti]MCB5909595.1 OsmC family protein [Streptomyces pinistramenti]